MGMQMLSSSVQAIEIAATKCTKSACADWFLGGAGRPGLVSNCRLIALGGIGWSERPTATKSQAVSQTGAKMEQKAIFEKSMDFDEGRGNCVEKKLTGKLQSDFVPRKDGEEQHELCNASGFKATIQRVDTESLASTLTASIWH